MSTLLHPLSNCISNQTKVSFPPTYRNKKEAAITPGLMKYAFNLLRSDFSTVYAVRSSHLVVFPPTDLSDYFMFGFTQFASVLLKISLC